jgi:hypothetical protein
LIIICALSMSLVVGDLQDKTRIKPALYFAGGLEGDASSFCIQVFQQQRAPRTNGNLAIASI